MTQLGHHKAVELTHANIKSYAAWRDGSYKAKRFHCIYILYNKERGKQWRVIYIGKTQRLYYRLLDWLYPSRQKSWATPQYTPTHFKAFFYKNTRVMNKIERDLIARHRPPLNTYLVDRREPGDLDISRAMEHSRTRK